MTQRFQDVMATVVGGDVLTVSATLTNEQGVFPVRVSGWLSATTNYFPPDAYGEPDEAGNAHRTDGATARAMTKAEKQAYYVALLDAAFPEAVDA